MRYDSPILLCAVVFALVATGARPLAAQTPDAGVSRTPSAVSPAEFQQLRWILGRWHGVGGGGLAAVRPFFEEYVQEDDSTIVERTFADSSFTRVVESHPIRLRDGQVRSEGTVVTLFASDSARFESPGGTRYTFVRTSDDEWRALFDQRAPGGAPRFFRMRRIHGTP